MMIILRTDPVRHNSPQEAFSRSLEEALEGEQRASRGIQHCRRTYIIDDFQGLSGDPCAQRKKVD